MFSSRGWVSGSAWTNGADLHGRTRISARRTHMPMSGQSLPVLDVASQGEHHQGPGHSADVLMRFRTTAFPSFLGTGVAMGFRTWLAATVVALSLALSGCGSGDDHSTAQPSTPVPAQRPDVGTCWAVPPKEANDPNHWFDDSPRVPCNKAHNAETVTVPILSKPTVAEAKKMADDVCWNAVRIYLGVDPEHWVPWGFGVSLPSRKQIADGASWMRCDATFPAEWEFGGIRSTTGSAEGVAVDPRAGFWACLNEDPKKSEQPFVPCDHPHLYEETGTLAILEGLAHYPSAATLAAEVKKQCSHAVHSESGPITVTARWDPAVSQTGELAGACFTFNKTGKPLPPRR